MSTHFAAGTVQGELALIESFLISTVVASSTEYINVTDADDCQ